jgi:hypothetical protein
MVSEPAGQLSGASDSQALPGANGRPKWYVRIGFWRAVAGMAVAIALAALIVLAEFSQLLTHRTSHYARRMAALNQTIQQLRRRISSAERRSAAVAERNSAAELLRRVVSASDLRTVKLVDPTGARKGDKAMDGASGTLAISNSQGAAVLEVTGVSPVAKGGVYRVWWQEKHRPDTLAAEFVPDQEGKATVPMQPPPRTASMVMITCEPGTDGTKPTRLAVLKGRIPPEGKQ